MRSTTSSGFWKGYGTLMGGAFVWGLMCAFADPRATDWPPVSAWSHSGYRSLWEVPIVVLGWMAAATLVFLAGRWSGVRARNRSKR